MNRMNGLQHGDVEPCADRVKRVLASIAGVILEERIVYDCPWDDFRFNYFRGKDDEKAAR
jgi:hypothetical protein